MAMEPIKLGIVGLGRAGRGMHVNELKSKQSKFQIVAACDLIAERRQEMADTHNCRTYADITDLINDPEVEVVDIATRSCDHYKHARMALEAGKTVFLEKPMCHTYEQAIELVNVATASQGKLFIRHNRRFEPGFQHIREIIASGVLGEVYEIRLRRLSFSRRDDWQTVKAYGGGQLLNWGPHIIDHALCFLESPVVDIWGNLKQVAAAGDAEDHLKVVLTGENGRVVDIVISGGAALSEPEYLIFGSRGALSSTGNTIHLRYLDPEQHLAPRTAQLGTPQIGTYGTPEELRWVEETLPVSPKGSAGMTHIWDELYDAIRTGHPYPITLSHAVEVMRVISAVKKGTAFAFAAAV